MKQERRKKRAITLAGGGPAAGLHIGALKALEEAGIQFDVFALSCVGAWVGIVYNTRLEQDAQGRGRADQTYHFFEKYCFRDDDSYEWFPLNRAFAPDFVALWSTWTSFSLSPQNNWTKLIPSPAQMWGSFSRCVERWCKPGGPTQHDINISIFNDLLAINPWARFLTSMACKSQMNGLARVYYEDCPAVKEVFCSELLYAKDQPDIYHNAWRMRTDTEPGKIQIFHNRAKPADPKGYLKITPKSLCACSALPFILESVKIDGYEYTEGALLDMVNFANLMRDHPDLDEVWVSRIVDHVQVRPARTLAGALANLPMQFAAEVGEDNIKVFRQKLLNQSFLRTRLVEIPINPRTELTFEWRHANLHQGFTEGREAVLRLLASHAELAADTVGG